MKHGQDATAGLMFLAVSIGLAGCPNRDVPALDGPRFVPPGERQAVALLVSDKSICTGVLIGPRVLLTARHCLSRGQNMHAVFEGFRPIRVAQAVPAPGADLAMLLLGRPAPGTILPMRLPPTASSGSLKGKAARLIGFGPVSPRARPAKRQAMARVVDELGEQLYLRTPPKDVCAGDSGGPILLSDKGGEYVAAVLAVAWHYDETKGCRAVAQGARIDRYLVSFIRPLLKKWGRPTTRR